MIDCLRFIFNIKINGYSLKLGEYYNFVVIQFIYYNIFLLQLKKSYEKLIKNSQKIGWLGFIDNSNHYGKHNSKWLK